DAQKRAPLVGVIYHQLGSLLVLLNSMRLLVFDRAATTGAMARVRGAAKAVDGWLGRFSLDDLLPRIGHHWKSIAGVLLGVGLLAWLATCFASVDTGEVGIVQRFGRATTDLEPGLHIRWPSPIETVARIRPNEVRLVEVGFRTLTEEQRVRLSASGGSSGG